MITLDNGIITVHIRPKGAELQSIEFKELQYMWSGDEAYWSKHSPVLFPIVGTLKDDTYYYKDQPYRLPRHGFARDRVFEVEKIDNEKAIFTLRENEDTMKVFPFPFVLKLIYELGGNEVKCTYVVENPGSDDLYFSVGGHPAFAAPLDMDLQYDDYYLEFNNESSLVRYKLDNGLISTKTEKITLDHNRRLPLSHSLFYEDAIVLKHLQSYIVTLASEKSEHGLHFHCKGFPFLGIWAAKDAPFVCIEPWCGIADGVDHNQHLTEKEGVEKLAAGSSWQRSWHVEIF